MFVVILLLGYNFRLANGAEDTKLSFMGEKIKINFDLRYRHEQIDKEGYDMRIRNRLRARLGVFVKANDELDFSFLEDYQFHFKFGTGFYYFIHMEDYAT